MTELLLGLSSLFTLENVNRPKPKQCYYSQTLLAPQEFRRKFALARLLTNECMSIGSDSLATPQPVCNCDDVPSVAQDTCVTYEPTMDVLARK